MSKSDDNQPSEFRRLMAEVDRIEQNHHPSAPNLGKKKLKPVAYKDQQDDQDETDFFFNQIDLNHGNTLGCEDQIAYNAGGIRVKTLKQLRKGQVNVQGTIDLHGMNQATAYGCLMDFINQATHNNWRCIRVIHGKGSEQAILKNCCYQWLKESYAVLAMQSCIPKDGGTGAIYVLLRGL